MEQQAQTEEWEREQAICHTHGGPRDECADPERPWFPQRRICYAAMEQAAADWRYGKLHEKRPYHDGTFTSWAKDRSPKHPYSAHDGVSIWVAETDLAPHDHFLGGAADCPDCGRGEDVSLPDENA